MPEGDKCSAQDLKLNGFAHFHLFFFLLGQTASKSVSNMTLSTYFCNSGGALRL